jgi:glycosyltransferase involved in cell wall biosynthesis
MRVYFYPHAYLRDRHLDTIRFWPAEEVVNPEMLQGRTGAQVSRTAALKGGISKSWKQKLPLVNIKRRPPGLDRDTVVYVWGAIMGSGPFITDLDNPYGLVGYNLNAMPLWRPVLRRLLESPRCKGIRCMSEACREGVRVLFGPKAAAKATVHYPRVTLTAPPPEPCKTTAPRFLFIGTQFDIKGGAPLLRAWSRVRDAVPEATLDVITHLPPRHAALADQPGLTVHEARFSRDEIWSDFMRRADVLVLPTYVESFGMVALEALAHGLAVIATDVYALKEMVRDGVNGCLVQPPISVWDGVMPSDLQRRLDQADTIVQAVDTAAFEAALVSAMIETVRSPERLLQYRHESLALFQARFGGAAPGKA